MIFKHNKNISRNFIAYLICIFFIISCGGGGDSSVTEPNKALTFSVSGLPATVESYDEVAIQIVPSIEGCIFQINSDFLWVVSSDGLSFTFRAPIIFTESKEFTFQIAPTNTQFNENVTPLRISYSMLQGIKQSICLILIRAIFHI